MNIHKKCGRFAHVACISLGSLTSVAALSSPAWSQEAAPETSPNDIVVTASKREERLVDVGSSVSVVTSEQIADLHATSVQDYIQLLPGVSLQSNGSPGRETISIRGISPQGSGGTTVTYIDNIPLGSTSVLAEPGTYAVDVNPADIERIEVLKGPQGTLYGAASMGGVIKYVLKKPSLTDSSADLSEDVSVPKGGDGTENIRGSVVVPIFPGSLSARVSGYYQNNGGFVDNVANGDKNINDGTAWGARGNVYWKPSEKFDVDVNFVHQTSSANAMDNIDINSETGNSQYSGYSVARYSPEYYDQYFNLVSIDGKYRTEFGEFLSASSYSENNINSQIDYTYLFADYGISDGVSDPTVSYGTRRNKKYTEELRFTSHRFGPFEAILGGYFAHEKVYAEQFYGFYDESASGGLGANLGSYEDSSKLTEFSEFINLTAYLSDQVDISGGYRHSNIKQRFDSASTGPLFTGDYSVDYSSQKFSENAETYMIGLRWHVNKNWLLYARAASGYRPGGGRTIPPEAPAGLADYYVSDSLWNYEIGTKLTAFGGALSLDVGAFWIDWKNIQSLITYGDVSIDGNGGTAVSKGLEGQISVYPIKGLTLSANATYNDAHFTETTESFTDGERIPGVAKASWALIGEYAWALSPSWTTTIGGDIYHRSSQIDSFLDVLPGYTTANVHLDLKRSNFGLSLYVKNLTDTRAILGTQLRYSSLPFWSAIVAKPRTFGISATQHF